MVAQPIEAQVVGVSKMIYMKSTSGSDGSYKLVVTVAVGTDPDINTVLVQDRVQRATARLSAFSVRADAGAGGKPVRRTM